MRSIKFLTAIFAIAAIMLTIECKKNSSCTPPSTPTATSNSPVATGNIIVLNTPTVTGAIYNWTGPNGYTSNFQNPAIPSATTAMAGTYNLKVTVGGCNSAAGSTVVSVINCTPPAAPTASSNSPVSLGNSLSFTTPAVTGATYSWTGPNGFTSALQNPTIASATLAMNGTYYLTISVNGCPSSQGSTVVVVDSAGSTPVAPCSIPSNTGEYSGLPNLQFTNISGAANNAYGNYEILANSANGDLYIDFPTSAVPSDTVYSINSQCPTGFLAGRQVCVSTVTGGTFSTYFVPTSGNVYVTSSGGKVTAVFCNLTFYGSTGSNSLSFTGSASVTTQ